MDEQVSIAITNLTHNLKIPDSNISQDPHILVLILMIFLRFSRRTADIPLREVPFPPLIVSSVPWGGATLTPFGTSAANWPAVPVPSDSMQHSIE